MNDEEDVQDEANVTSDLIVESENTETVVSEIKKINERKEENTTGKRPRTGTVSNILQMYMDRSIEIYRISFCPYLILSRLI